MKQQPKNQPNVIETGLQYTPFLLQRLQQSI
jgi:hypothetical protein